MHGLILHQHNLEPTSTQHTFQQAGTVGDDTHGLCEHKCTGSQQIPNMQAQSR